MTAGLALPSHGFQISIAAGPSPPTFPSTAVFGESASRPNSAPKANSASEPATAIHFHVEDIRKPASGEILLDGQSIEKADPARLRELGLAHIPEDRHHMGLVLKFEEYENSVLGYHRNPAYSKGPILDLDAIRKDAMEKIEKYDIRPPNPRLKTANFSGGNQQKIVVAREIERDPTALIIGQPTRGVDIGAIEFIHRRIIEMRDAGKAILLVSVELDEIRALSDRILVMFAGHVVGEKTPDAGEQTLGLMMAGIAA